MVEFYVKIHGRLHVARKRNPDRDGFDYCKGCSLKRVCHGGSEINSHLVGHACDLWGYGWKPVKDKSVPAPLKKGFWETIEPDHPQVVIEVKNPKYGLVRIPCDAEMVPLVVKLNLMGVKTEYSCQGYPGSDFSAYISLMREEDTPRVTAEVLKFWKTGYVYRDEETLVRPESVAYYWSEHYYDGKRHHNMPRHLGVENGTTKYIRRSDYPEE